MGTIRLPFLVKRKSSKNAECRVSSAECFGPLDARLHALRDTHKMNRRNFVKSGAAAGAVLAGGITSFEAEASPMSNADEPFKLKFAPHFGMFKNSAGDNLIDQLKFMHEMGFRALEDNGMKGKSVELQEQIASEMSRLDMEMAYLWRTPFPGANPAW